MKSLIIYKIIYLLLISAEVFLRFSDFQQGCLYRFAWDNDANHCHLIRHKIVTLNESVQSETIRPL